MKEVCLICQTLLMISGHMTKNAKVPLKWK